MGLNGVKGKLIIPDDLTRNMLFWGKEDYEETELPA